jgi:hypothetical protein
MFSKRKTLFSSIFTDTVSPPTITEAVTTTPTFVIVPVIEPVFGSKSMIPISVITPFTTTTFSTIVSI